MCRYNFDNWLSLATGGVSAIKGVRMKRHARACSACQKHQQDVQVLLNAARPFAQAEPLAHVQERVWSACVASSVLPTSERKTAMFSPVWKPALFVGGIGIAVVGLLVAPTFSPRTPAPVAFARVEEALSNVQTAIWTSTNTTTVRFEGAGSRPDKSFQSVMVNRNFLQTNPGRVASVLLAHTQGGLSSPRIGRKTVGDGHYWLTANSHVDKPSERVKYYRIENSDPVGRTPQERIIRSVLFPRGPEGQNSTEHISNRLHGTVVERSTAWTSTPDQIQGRDVLRFENTTTRVSLAVPKYKMPESKTQYATQVWVDPETYRIVRREQFSLPEGEGKFFWRSVHEDFKYNVALAAGTFEIPRPPVGVWFRFNDFTNDRFDRWRVRPEEKRQIEQLIRNVASAWNRGDEQAFLALFDFEATARNGQAISGIPIAPEAERQRKHWLGRIRNRTPYYTWKVNSMGGLEMGLPWHLHKLNKASDPFPPEKALSTRAIRFIPSARGTATLTEGGSPVAVQTTFGVTRSDDGKFRLTDLNMFTRDGKRWSTPELKALAKKPASR